ncbi:MAG TPA: CHAD domain-containing protein, partial [Acetobacteraceae bacterium]|nr:CHAD domain-containing protein [Acetobacteraceae bacterium]
REWDVFLEGTGMAVAAAFPENAALARLLKAAARRREAAYDALRAELGSAGFRRLMLQLSSLAMLRPWQRVPGERIRGEGQQEAAEGRLAEEGPAPPLTAATVAELLQRRQRKLLAAATNITEADAQHLHAIRLRAKRLRYAGELFSPLFPRKDTQRFLHRLARLQDRLGVVNDAQAVDRLLGDLGAMGSGHAAGLVRGFVAANALRERARVEPAWRKFRRQVPFWH